MDRWLVCTRRNPGARLRLFCFPYAGGAAQAFHSWPEALPGDVEVCAIQPPGRGHRISEPPYTRWQPLVDAIVRVLLPQLDRPFVFFGHSLGAVLAFETACLLRRHASRSPVWLVASGRRAPHLPLPHPPLFALPADGFLRELRQMNGTPDGVFQNQELLELLLPVLRADFEVNETYVYEPGPRLDCPITVFGGVEDDNVDLEALQAWQHHTAGDFDRRLFAGGHFFINSARPAVLQTLAGIARAAIDADGRSAALRDPHAARERAARSRHDR